MSSALRQSIYDVLSLSATPADGAPPVGTAPVLATHNKVIPLLDAATPRATPVRLAADAHVYEDALRQREGTIQDLQTQMAKERIEHDARVNELAVTLREQSLVTKETTHALAARIEALQFASAHQGMMRDRFEAFNQAHVAASVVESSRRMSSLLSEEANAATALINASCERTLDHLRFLTVAAKETVTQRRPSEELAEVQSLILADHARQFVLLRERVRARVLAAMRRELEVQFTSGIEATVSERVRDTILPAAVDGLAGFVNDIVGKTLSTTIEAERAAAKEDTLRVGVQQSSLLRQMQAAHAAHLTLTGCRDREMELAGIFDELDEAQKELRSAHQHNTSEIENKIRSMQASLIDAKKANVAMRSDLRAGGRVVSPSPAKRRGPSPRMGVPRPTPLASDAPPAVANAEKKLNVSPPRTQPVVHSGERPPRSPPRSASAAKRRSVTKRTDAVDGPVVELSVSKDGHVSDIPIAELRRLGLVALLDRRTPTYSAVAPVKTTLKQTPVKPALANRLGGGMTPQGDDGYSMEERAALFEHRRLRQASHTVARSNW